jgi:hypothetical protein
VFRRNSTLESYLTTATRMKTVGSSVRSRRCCDVRGINPRYALHLQHFRLGRKSLRAFRQEAPGQRAETLKAVVFQFEEPGWIVEGFERPGELGGHNRSEDASISGSFLSAILENLAFRTILTLSKCWRIGVLIAAWTHSRVRLTIIVTVAIVRRGQAKLGPA